MLELLTTNRLSRKAKRIRALILASVLVLLAVTLRFGLSGAFGQALAGGNPEAEVVKAAIQGRSKEVVTHIVRPGETLWTIAEQYNPDRDPRETIREIGILSDIDPNQTLIPGTRLQIPIR